MQERVTKNAALSAASAQPFPSNAFDDRMMRIIRIQVSRLIKTKLFPEHMRDDLVQKLSCIICSELATYNPERGNVYTYARKIAFNRSINIINHTRVLARRSEEPQDMLSLDQVVNEEMETLGELIDANDVACLMGRQTRCPFEFNDLVNIVCQTMEEMPEEYAAICQAILSGESISSLAKRYGVSRTWFREKYLNPIRKIFIKVGLDQYLREG